MSAAILAGPEGTPGEGFAACSTAVCGAVGVSTSTDFANWTRINSTERFGRPHWLVGGPPSDPTRGPWAEPGPSPQRLSDGNLLFLDLLGHLGFKVDPRVGFFVVCGD